MTHEIELQGHIPPGELMDVLDGLLKKLTSSSPLEIISPIAEFVHYSGFSYGPTEAVRKALRDKVEWGVFEVLKRQTVDECGKYEPFWTLEDLCGRGIIAHHLGMPYDLEPPLLKSYPDILDGVNRDVTHVLDFELHHFDYEDELENLDLASKSIPLLPLDILYFAQLNGLLDSLDGAQLNNPLYERCRSTLETGGPSPRRFHTSKQVKEYLGSRLSEALDQYCREYEGSSLIAARATQILYRRNRVKGFLGGELKIPEQLARYDDEAFANLDPLAIWERINAQVSRWGPNDCSAELGLPSELSKQEYRLFRMIQKTMEYVRRGVLTYDTDEKRNLLTIPQIPNVTSSRFLLE